MTGHSEMLRAALDAHQRENRPEVFCLGEQVHTARKHHRCDCCRGVIQPGQQYRREVLIVDGDMEVSKFHLLDADCPARLRWR